MKNCKKKILIIGAVLIVLIIISCLSLIKDKKEINALSGKVYEEAYEEVSETEKIPSPGTSVSLSAYDYASPDKITEENLPRGYDAPAADLKEGDEISFEFDIPEAGLYKISADYAIKQDSNVDCTMSVSQGEKEDENIIFPRLLKSADYPFDRDENGNEIVPEVTAKSLWQKGNFRTLKQKTTDYILFPMEKGVNSLTLRVNSGEIYMGNIYIESPEKVPSYEEYISRYPKDTGGESLIVIEAERISYKNSESPRPISVRDTECVPYESNKYTMSAAGGDTWQNNGEALYYKFFVEKEGWYRLAMKAKQSNGKSSSDNTYIHRSITIDGEIPFKEAQSMIFPSVSDWEITLLGNEEQAYMVYLKEGEHYLGIEADATMYMPVAETIGDLNDEVNNIALEIRKLIGNNTDVYRDWELEKYIPDISERLIEIAKQLETQKDVLTEINMGQDKNKDITNLKICAERLRSLAQEPDSIPNHMTLLSEGTGSVSQMLGELTESLTKQPLMVDQIYLAQSDAEFPDYSVTPLKKFAEGFKYFLSSFKNEDYRKEDKEITVWVNRARNYIDLLQKMADSQFTPETGIKVNFSVMPNEQKLILANTTNTQPDAALGVSSYLPYDLAIRGAVCNLREFEDFNETASCFSPGAFITHTYDGGIYALPETQDFYVLFYRSDLMEKLHIPIPDTWNDVIEILPQLQRYGMNFYVPLSLNSSFKTFSATLPFIYQKGASIYSEQGLTVALNSEQGLEAMKFMTDLYTIYGLPSQVGDFYQEFRNGVIPMGVSNFATYLKLEAAASELSGRWDISVMPGFEDENGNVSRWSTGSGQASVIFSKSDKREEAWEFLKWWSSAEVQTEFGSQMKLLYGDEYLWNSANLEAFKQMPIDDKHKETILKQWEWLYEFPKTPASYMVEREISNVWNKIVFDGENARSALDDSVILMNQELSRKMEEFGYISDGKAVKNYQIPTIELIESWIKDDE